MAPRGENRIKLIEAMKTLSLTKGYAATTVDEVCAEANVSKGSFYHHFDTKEDIGFAALNAYFDSLIDAIMSGDFVSYQDPVERLQGFLTHTKKVCVGPQMINGCLIGSYALNLAETFPTIQSRLAEQFDELAQFVQQLLDDVIAVTGIDLPSKQLGQQFIVALEGSIVLAKAHADTQLLTSGIDLYAQHIDLLTQRHTPN